MPSGLLRPSAGVSDGRAYVALLDGAVFASGAHAWRISFGWPNWLPAWSHDGPSYQAWIPIWLFAVPFAIRHAMDNRIREARRQRGACQRCGYSRAGLPRDAACPECGAADGVAGA